MAPYFAVSEITLVLQTVTSREHTGTIEFALCKLAFVPARDKQFDHFSCLNQRYYQSQMVVLRLFNCTRRMRMALNKFNQAKFNSIIKHYSEYMTTQFSTYKTIRK